MILIDKKVTLFMRMSHVYWLYVIDIRLFTYVVCI
jgi:hypothetical protein